jgi:choline/glycine/proline betaine transport protein
MFMARVSYGITLRKFVAGAILAPTLASMFWFSIFGGGGLYYILQGNEAIANADSTSALFTFIEALPIAGVLATLLSLLSIVVVAVFFATSSDSGSLVVDILTNGGDPNPDWKQRLFWAVTEGAIAAILLVAGNAAGGDPLGALQTTAVAAGLPFSFVLVFVCWGLLKALSEESVSGSAARTPEPSQPATRPSDGYVNQPDSASPQKVYR